MAETIVQSACTKLRSAIRHEVTVRWKLTSDLQEMLRALDAVKPLLGEAEKLVMRGFNLGSASREQDVREWVKRVRMSAYGISDMVDELQDTPGKSPPAGKVTSILPCFAVVHKNHPMADKMKKMTGELSKIELDSKSLDFKPYHREHQDIHVTEQVEEEEIQRILDVCTYEGPVILPIKEQERQGKTSLARMVFNHTGFQDHSRVWVHASETHDLHKIGISIISHLSGGEEIMSHHGSSNQYIEHITKRLHELLNNKKTLVVLDGLYLKGEDCIQFRRMFCVGDKSTKVIVIATPRGDMEPSFFTAGPIELKWLREDICWTIIKDTSGFEGRTKSDREELERIGRGIAKQCSDEPFQAKVLGAMLRHNDARGWKEALHRNSCMLSDNDPTPLYFKIAYTIMPSPLKLCYAYCAMLPEGHTVVKDRLIRQWIALGLIEPQPSDGSSVTQRAEEYITSLLHLSLLQITNSASAFQALEAFKVQHEGKSFNLSHCWRVIKDEKFKAQFAALMARGGKNAMEEVGKGEKARPRGKTNSKKEDKRDAASIALIATVEGMMTKKDSREEKRRQDKEEQMNVFMEIQRRRLEMEAEKQTRMLEMEAEKQPKMLEIEAANAKTKAKEVALASMMKGVEIMKVDLNTMSPRKRLCFEKMQADMLKFDDE